MHLQRRYSLGEAGSEIFTPHCNPPSIWSDVHVSTTGPRTVMGCEPEENGNGTDSSPRAGPSDHSEVSFTTSPDGSEPAASSSTPSAPCCDIDSMDLCSSCLTSAAASLVASTPASTPSSPLPSQQRPLLAAATTPSTSGLHDLSLLLPPPQPLAEPAENDSRPSLLTLPPEIRHQIYQHLPDTLILHRPLIYGITPFSGRKTHCLSAICRQIRQEVMAIFYGQNEWVVSLEFKIMYEAFRRWVLEEVGEGAGSLRKLRVGVRCEGLAPKVRRRVIKDRQHQQQQQQQQQMLHTQPPPNVIVHGNAGAAVAVPASAVIVSDYNPDLNIHGDADMDTDAETLDGNMDLSTDNESVISSDGYLDLDDLHDSMETDGTDSVPDTSSTAHSSGSASTTLTPPPSMSAPEPESAWETVTLRADGDATFSVDLSEKHQNGLVTVLRSEAMPQDTENVRLILESVVGWLWEKRMRGTMTGADLVEGMDRFLSGVGVHYG